MLSRLLCVLRAAAPAVLNGTTCEGACFIASSALQRCSWTLTTPAATTAAAAAATLWPSQRRCASAAAAGSDPAPAVTASEQSTKEAVSSTAGGGVTASSAAGNSEEAARAAHSAEARTRAEAARPVLPQNKILRLVIMTWDEPLTSQQLYALAQERHAASFPTRTAFKRALRRLQRERLVVAKPSPAQRGRSAPLAGSFVFHATHLGERVDLDAAGTPVLEAARRAADKWTVERLPRYVEYLQAGLVPASPEDEPLRRHGRRERGSAAAGADARRLFRSRQRGG